MFVCIILSVFIIYLFNFEHSRPPYKAGSDYFSKKNKKNKTKRTFAQNRHNKIPESDSLFGNQAVCRNHLSSTEHRVVKLKF